MAHELEMIQHLKGVEKGWPAERLNGVCEQDREKKQRWYLSKHLKSFTMVLGVDWSIEYSVCYYRCSLSSPANTQTGTIKEIEVDDAKKVTKPKRSSGRGRFTSKLRKLCPVMSIQTPWREQSHQGAWTTLIRLVNFRWNSLITTRSRHTSQSK